LKTITSQPKDYRRLVSHPDLVAFRVMVKETDLMVQAYANLQDRVRESILACRSVIEATIRENPAFLESLRPIPLPVLAPPIIREMIQAGHAAGVGPMAAVAGAVAEFVGRDLLAVSDQVIVENGGDIFLRTLGETVVAVYAGNSELSGRVGIRLPHARESISVCTSSGSVGHSTSFGSADAVCVISSSASLADAAATAIGNRVQRERDVRAAIDFGRTISGIQGVLVIIAAEIGIWGDLEVVPLSEKKVEFSNEKG